MCIFLVRRPWRLFNFAIWNHQYSCVLGCPTGRGDFMLYIFFGDYIFDNFLCYR
jgi:hypothetical protein